MRTKSYLVLALFGLGLAACGGETNNGDPSSKVDSNEAKVVQKATTDAVTEVVKSKLLDADALLDGAVDAESWISGAGDAYDIAGTMTSALGGALEVAGTGAQAAIDAATDAVDLDLDLTFDDWADEGLVLNGKLQLDVAITGYDPPAVTVKVKGNVAVSGDFAGSFPIDLSIDISGETTSVCGDVAGYGDACFDPDPSDDPADDPADDPVPALDSAEASLFQSAVLFATAQLQQELVLGLAGLSSAVPLPSSLVQGDASDVIVSGVMDGIYGGSMKLLGDGAEAAAGFDLDIDAQLLEWKDAAGVVLVGNLKVSYEITEMMPLEASVTVTGTCNASGAATGDADVNLRMSVTDEETITCGTVGSFDMSDPEC